MQVCISIQTYNHASTQPISFLQAGCPSCCPTNSVKALKASTEVWLWMKKGWSQAGDSALTLLVGRQEGNKPINILSHFSPKTSFPGQAAVQASWSRFTYNNATKMVTANLWIQSDFKRTRTAHNRTEVNWLVHFAADERTTTGDERKVHTDGVAVVM